MDPLWSTFSSVGPPSEYYWFFSCSDWILCVSICEQCLLFCHWMSLRRVFQFSSFPPIRYLYMLVRFPPSLLFHRLNSVNSCSLFLYERCYSPFIILVILHWTLSSSSISCTEEPSPGHSTPGVAWPVLNRREKSPSSTCLAVLCLL